MIKTNLHQVGRMFGHGMIAFAAKLIAERMREDTLEEFLKAAAHVRGRKVSERIPFSGGWENLVDIVRRRVLQAVGEPTLSLSIEAAIELAK